MPVTGTFDGELLRKRLDALGYRGEDAEFMVGEGMKFARLLMAAVNNYFETIKTELGTDSLPAQAAASTMLGVGLCVDSLRHAFGRELDPWPPVVAAQDTARLESSSSGDRRAS